MEKVQEMTYGQEIERKSSRGAGILLVREAPGEMVAGIIGIFMSLASKSFGRATGRDFLL